MMDTNHERNLASKMLENQNLRSQYAHFALATVASLLVFSLYSMVDGFFVSWGVNEYAMSGVNLAVPYTNVLFSIAVLFAVGTSTIIAIYLGEQKVEQANRLFSQNIAVLCIISAVVTAVVMLTLPAFTRLLGADEITYGYTFDYLRGLVPFSACFIISYNLEILIKTDGYPKKAFWAVISGCICNCILDYVAIFLLDMGTYGAALATGISQLLTCCVYLYHFLREKTTFHFTGFKMDFSIYKRLIPLGIPDGVTEICNGLMIFLFNRTIVRCLGADGLVSYTIIAYTNTVVINCLVGLSQAAQPLVSYHYGKKEHDACRKLLKYAMVSAGIFALVIWGLLRMGGGYLIQAFLGTENSALNAASLSALHRYSLSYLLVGFNIVIGGYLTARERPAGSLVISVSRGFILQAGALLILSYSLAGTTIWFAPVISEILCLGIAAVFLVRSYKHT